MGDASRSVCWKNYTLAAKDPKELFYKLVSFGLLS